jgi:hypothetical protein
MRNLAKRKKLEAFWGRHQDEWRKLAPIAEDEHYSDFQKPVHTQEAPKIIPRGGHPDEPVVDQDEIQRKVLEQVEPPKEKPKKKEPKKEEPKKRDKWETVKV